MTATLQEITLGGQLTPEHPGGLLKKALLHDLGLSMSEACRRLDISLTYLEDIFCGREDISEDIAKKAGCVLGSEKEEWKIWETLQVQYNMSRKDNSLLQNSAKNLSPKL